jgi:hypothetical protein
MRAQPASDPVAPPLEADRIASPSDSLRRPVPGRRGWRQATVRYASRSGSRPTPRTEPRRGSSCDAVQSRADDPPKRLTAGRLVFLTGSARRGGDPPDETRGHHWLVFGGRHRQRDVRCNRRGPPQPLALARRDATPSSSGSACRAATFAMCAAALPIVGGAAAPAAALHGCGAAPINAGRAVRGAPLGVGERRCERSASFARRGAGSCKIRSQRRRPRGRLRTRKKIGSAAA